ncbi:MAG TPA: DUF5309 family protein, partial [Anaerolineales bacterium]|nr:DUF5309 family protein [Anaerolineales bacterium]
MLYRNCKHTADNTVWLPVHICLAVKGVFASDSGIVGDPKGDFATALLQEVPTGNAPFFALSSGMKSTPAIDTVVHWFEESHLSGRTTLAESGFDDSETDMTVADASFLVAGAILLVETTGEQVLVTGVSGSVLTIVRGFAGTSASAATSGDGIQKIGTAQAEASEKPTAVMNVGDPIFNFTQIFRNTWNVSGTTAAVQYYTGNKVAKSKRDASLFHAEDIERSLWFGRRSNGTVGGMPFRTMNGLDAMITTNVDGAGSTTNWQELEDFLRAIFEKNIKGEPNERIAFCGNQALSVING